MKNTRYPIVKGKTKLYKTVHAIETKEVDAQIRTLIVKISTNDVDRSGDIVVPKGVILDNYLTNPVVAAFHRYNEPAIAKTLEIRVADDFILAKLEFVPEGKYPLADILYEQYKGGFMNAWSIGFRPMEYEEIPNGGYKFLKWELFEYSAVLVPDNQNALTVMRSKGISDEDINKALEATHEKEQVRAEFATKKTEGDKPQEKSEEKDADTPEDTETPDETKQTLDEAQETIKTLEAEVEALKGKLEAKATEDTPVAELSAKQLKELFIPPVVEQKDVSQVTSLAYVLSELQWLAYCFEYDEVSQETRDKLNQAISLILEAIKEQAELGKKSYGVTDADLTKMTPEERAKLLAWSVEKAGRTISAKHEGMLKDACDHMKSAAESVEAVLNTVAEQPEEEEDQPNGDEGKSVKVGPSFMQKLANSLKTNNQKQDLTLRLLKEIKGEKGGEK